MQIVYKILLLFLFCNILFAKNLAFIESKPQGIARDFYIYEFIINNEIDLETASKLYDLIDLKSPKIMSVLKSKIPQEKLPYTLLCSSKNFDELIQSDDECLNIGFKLDYAFNGKLDSAIIDRLTSSKTKNRIKILRSKNILDTLFKNGDGEDFNSIYFSISKKIEIFNKAPKNLKNISNKDYSKALYHIIISNKFPKFTKALLKANITNVNDFSFFALGLNELENGSKNKALKYFSSVVSSTKNRFLKDRALFWQYKISAKSKYLKELAQSEHFNLYSLYATKKLKAVPKFQIILQDDEMFASLSEDKPPFDISNPFEWQIISQNILQVKNRDALLDISKLFYYKETLPHFIFVINRYYNFSKNFFIMPYYDKLDFDNQTKNLVYAVARQESKFIPSVVSRSYALGMMQIMPFNVDNFAKEQKMENITLESMFNPQIALQFGAYYLNHLKKEFIHPLFISYAYNGGPTFIRNFLKDKSNFSKKNKFEPWFSMEFIPYEESRFYGMKVMANYIMYNEINNTPIDIDIFMKEALH